MKSQQALMREGGSDYLLDWDSVWITVNNLSINILKGKTEVRVEIYPLHEEMGVLLAGLEVPYEVN